MGLGRVGVALVVVSAVAILASPGRALAQQCVPPKQLGVAYVLDDSGSMADSDPQALRGTATEIGLHEIGPGRVAAAVAFADTARVVFGPTLLAPDNIAPLSQSVKASL